MKRQWQIRRQFQEAADAARRWDQAYRARSQGNNPWQTQDMALGVSRSSRIFLWSWSPLSGIRRPSV